MKKWYYHCPICKQFVNKDKDRFLTEQESVQCWHKQCLWDELVNQKLLEEIKRIRNSIRQI